MKFLYKPFTYQWLYYSDFLGSFDAQRAIVANLNKAMLVVCASLLTSFLVGRWVFTRVAAAAGRNRHPLFIAGVLGLIGFSCLPFVGWQMTAQKIPYSQAAQPIVAFAASLLDTSNNPLYSLAPSKDLSDFIPLPAGPNAATDSLQNERLWYNVQKHGTAPSSVRNVIFFVMESAAAEYFGLYGSKLGATPELDQRRSASLVVSDAYAHTPMTTSTMVSLLTATYPWVTGRLVATEFPDIQLTSISSLLKDRGFHTAFFSAADLTFQKSDQFLALQKFDLVKDYHTIPCEKAAYENHNSESFSSIAWEHLGGVSDDCAAEALHDWIKKLAAEPFFAVLWTNMTHYPYPVSGPENTFPVRDKSLNRYLNALQLGDKALGRLLEQLDALGIADSTLVVVLGDHGEAFGRHGDRVHGSAIYEDNVRIPLVFINKALFHGEVADTIGGIVDVAPTVAHLIGLERGSNWQGRSI